MNYHFELRKDKINKDGLIPIRLVVTHGKARIRKNINAKTIDTDWNKDNYSINNHKKSTFYEFYKVSNKEIQSVIEKVEFIFKFFEYNEIDFSEQVFNERFDEDNTKISIDFFEAFQEFIDVSKLTKANGTIKKYTTVLNFLKDFKTFTKYPLRFDSINKKFEEVFMLYCFEERKIVNNYYGKLISIIKTFMQWSFDRQYHNSIEFKRIKRTEDEIEVIYLSMDELMELYNHKFENKSMERARDFFCFGCFTGLRHSDIYNLDNANIYDDHINLSLIKTKTNDHIIPLNNFSKAILDKYKDTIYKPIPKIYSQKLNKKIQDCCEELKWYDKVKLVRYIGSERVYKTFQKYQLITSHVARKTFITNGLILGMTERVLRNITNSKDEKSFRRYVKIEEVQKQKEMNIWNTIKINKDE
ncbi:phage integrase SAM-like domain-containing protein [Empedobacter sp.]|uniref:phage integrase SAM-like domain-containing protein n=1 Tax=Empedobacter sp. TaxID=1927715 RepID=UPI0028AA155E|nr:phage integrase SAM-like domain-containing protein [Empedobacter sp.]